MKILFVNSTSSLHHLLFFQSSLAMGASWQCILKNSHCSEVCIDPKIQVLLYYLLQDSFGFGGSPVATPQMRMKSKVLGARLLEKTDSIASEGRGQVKSGIPEKTGTYQY